MKILLINPVIREKHPPYNFPIGLGIIAAIMRNNGHKVYVYDQNGLRSSYDDVFRFVRGIKGFDVVGTGGLITTYNQVKTIVSGLRDILPKTKIILGGGITVEPHVIFENMDVDFCVHGEGEHTFSELCNMIESNGDNFSNIDGISYLDHDKLIITPGREVEKNLDKFPMPAYDLFPAETYFKNNVIKNHLKMNVDTKRCAALMWSRGCPNKCTFCWRMMGRGVRYRSFDLLFQEIDYLRSNYEVDSYLFIDECINANRNKAKEFAEKLVELGYSAPWYSHARVDNIDEELAAIFKTSGCVGLNFGIESASPKMLKVMNKKANPEQAASAVKIAQKAGIQPNCTFIIGMPGETKSTVMESISWVIKNRVQKKHFFFATPYPGCDLYNLPVVQNRIIEKYRTKDGFFSALGDVVDFTVNMTDFADKQLLNLKKQIEFKILLLSPDKWIKLLCEPDRWWSSLKEFIKRFIL